MNAEQFTKLFNRVPKFVTGLTILAFFALVVVGMFDCMNPIMQSQMSMEGSGHSKADCIPGKNCGMNISEHLSTWQSMFVANISSNLLNFFATLLMAGFVFGIYKLLSIPQISPLTVRYLYYERDHRDSKLYNYLVRIFASGIVQPKLFA